jgi:hypothetical protein
MGMADQRSIGIAEKSVSAAGQRTCTAAAWARHWFLLSKFQAFPIPDSPAVQLRFTALLPRAQTLAQSINFAMIDADVKVPKGSVEVTAEQEHQMLSLLSLFVQVQPEIVEVCDGTKGSSRRKTYAYYCKQAFMVESGRTAEQALAATYPFKTPRVIAGVLKVRGEIFHVTHTALRKAACSPITSAAHSAFHLATPATQEWVVDSIDKTFNSRDFRTAEDVVDAVRTGLTEGENQSWRKSFDGILLRNLFTTFSDQDWFDMLCYFFIWPGSVARQKVA